MHSDHRSLSRSKCDLCNEVCNWVGECLQIRVFSALKSSISELLRFLERMAASKPTSWLFLLFNFLSHSGHCFETLPDCSGCFPLDFEPCRPKSVCLSVSMVFGVSEKMVRTMFLHSHCVLYPQRAHAERMDKRSTSIDFAENQLSLSLIGLSPLSTIHLNLLQQVQVRSSKNLQMFFSTWSWIDHPVSGPKLSTNAIFHTCFRFAFIIVCTKCNNQCGMQ